MPFIALIALSLLAGWYVQQDAARRAMRPTLWAGGVILTSGLLLPIYLMVRRPLA